MSTVRILWAAALPVAALMLVSCVHPGLKPPSVTIAHVDVIEATIFEQRFAFTLRVQNPNDRDMPVTGLRFEIELNDQPFARGVSDKAVTVPRFGEELLQVTAVSSLSSILRQIQEWSRGERRVISCRIRGTLSTGLPLGRLSFDEQGMLELPESRRETEHLHRQGGEGDDREDRP